MTRNSPTKGRNSPITIRAVWNALQQAVGVTTSPQERQGHFGKRWMVSDNRTVTSTQSSLYIYIENPDSDRALDVEGATLYTNRQVTVSIYDEPTLDETTFTAGEFRNTRSSVTKNPPWNLYKETGNNVTISDKGRLFMSDLMDAGVTQNAGAHFDAPGYIIDPESSALIEISLDTNNDTDISASFYTHEQVFGPDLTDLDGTN